MNVIPTYKEKLTSIIFVVSTTGAGLMGYQAATGQERPCATLATPPPYSGAGCSASVDSFFTHEVWAKVGALSCLKCHKSGGDAEDSKFVLCDPQRSQGDSQAEVIRRNRDAFFQMARLKEGDQARLLLKVVGKLENYSCRQGLLTTVPDPHYTVRAWRGVVTYLLRQHEFPYE